MTDPRLAESQRVPHEPAGAVCAHVYWCRTRITVVTLMLLVLIGLVVAAVWWFR